MNKSIPLCAALVFATIMTPVVLAVADLPPAPPPPQQFQMNTCWAGIACMDLNTLTIKFNNAFFYAAAAIALCIFIVGAFMMTISAGNDTMIQNAKRAMKGSLIGIALVVGSFAIYRTVVFFIYS